MRRLHLSRTDQESSLRVLLRILPPIAAVALCTQVAADIGETREALERKLGTPLREIKAPNGDVRLFFKDGDRLVVAEVVGNVVESEAHFGVDLKQAEKIIERYPSKWVRQDYSGNTSWRSEDPKLGAGFLAKFPGPSGGDNADVGELLKPYAERGFFTIARIKPRPSKPN